MKRGIFITVEGTDGAGKTTQIMRMKEYLEEAGHEVVVTREPGGTIISEKIRELLLDVKHQEMDKTTEMLLYAAARAQLVAQVIKPAVLAGKIVICDRFVDSSFVYQGFGRGIDFSTIEAVNKVALDGIWPDITFFFDISPEVALKRRIATTGADRIEKEKLDFHWKVYHGYKELAGRNPERIRSIDSSRGIEEIAGEVRKYLAELLLRA